MTTATDQNNMNNHAYSSRIYQGIDSSDTFLSRELPSTAEMDSSSATLPTQPQQQQQQQQQQYHQNSLNTVRKTMSTMETLGIRLPPPGFRADTTSAPTTNPQHQPQQWRHDPVPNVHITPPNTTYPQSYEQPYASLNAGYAQFQAGNDHFDECGLSYTPTLSGHDGDNTQLLSNYYHNPYTNVVPCQDEHYHYPGMPGSSSSFMMMRYPDYQDAEGLYPFDPYNNHNMMQQYSSASSSSLTSSSEIHPTMIRPLSSTAEGMSLPGYSLTSYCDQAYNHAGLEGVFVPNSNPSVASVPSLHMPTYDTTKSYESRQTHLNKRMATEDPSPGSPHVSKRPRMTLTPSLKTSSGGIQKPVHQPSRSEALAKLNTPSANTPISRPAQSPHHYQQLAPPFLLPSNADSSGVPMKPLHSSSRRTASSSSTESHHKQAENNNNRKLSYTNSSKPPDLLGPLFEEQESPPLKDMTPDDPEMIPHKQNLRFENDLYTPRWVRGHGNKREGWCGICKPGRWLVLKNSAFWYDKSFSHGVSAVTGRAFEGPKSIRRIKRIKNNPDSRTNSWPAGGGGEGSENRGIVSTSRLGGKTTTTWEGLCGSCNEWIALVSSKKKGTTWFRHAYRCQSQFKARERDSRSALSSPLPSTSG
ncbi:conserved hypothetical protein [Talaromyces stipitatus ATCC 10500]|uniref:Transcription regulator Rua1 C-terminal domain-containing protein n=1 Tax=Talaromyces stipitatus (strain ATCC 10500 / CBS 375.48 / QM 6759 / NRRL 1006) TaxID=441959 RepID=B8M864_TALSN|nr:uncharacterized protein TSTA_032790 [Talaromyces stipitatus ATCC 10500]EED20026.1 conserved hypothetical protein [Talaromyces stipitatus ATCC 10500]